jgi:hypothetical protein
MASRRRPSHHLAHRVVETAWAAPLVVSHRLHRMAAAGRLPSARDRREFSRMGWEKVAAFHESWFAMALEGWRVQQTMWWSMLTSWWTPWWASGRRGGPDAARALLGIAGRGFAPVHRRAVANVRRLSATRHR